jgi:ketosteroid isomerase-like protein
LAAEKIDLSYLYIQSACMKKWFFAAFLFIAIRGISQSKDEIAIRLSLDQQSAAWNRGDLEGFMKTYWQNDSLRFIGTSGITYGWKNTLDHYKKSYPDTSVMGKLRFALLDVKQLSATYFHVIGKWHLQRTIGDAEGYFTLVFKKINGRWLIIADHSS